jgi:hypothetical protein
MKKLIIALTGLFYGLTTQAQTVDEVVSAHVEAIGGKEKLAALKSMYMESISVMQNGNEVTSKIWKVQDKLMRREIAFGMGQMTSIVTDKEGWNSNPRNGGAFEAVPADRLAGMKMEMDIAGPLVDYAAKGHKAELAGREDVNGTSCHAVKLTLSTGREITYLIDPKTYYVVRTKTKGGGFMRGGGGGGGGARNPEAEMLTDYSDHRKTPEGYVFPYTITIQGMGAAQNVEKLEVNKEVDAKLYKPGN